MDSYSTNVPNSTPLKPELLNQVHSGHKHHVKLADAFLIFSFTLLITSIGFWTQSTLLQPPTKASQKIIDASPTPTPTIIEEELLEPTVFESTE